MPLLRTRRYVLRSQAFSPITRYRSLKSSYEARVTVHPRQQRAQPQQLDFVQDESGFGWHGRQPIDSPLRFLQVGVETSAQQGFHQNGGGLRTIHWPPERKCLLEGSPRQLDRVIEIAGSGLLLGKNCVDDTGRGQGEALL
jgi:hypothetical protein